MKEKKQIPDEARLLNSWVMTLANRLQYHKFLNRSEAFRQAHLTLKLLMDLGEGEVVFTYKKDNGFLRRARGTLCTGISEAYDKWVYADEQKHKVSDEGTSFNYFDLDMQNFRTFKAENLIDIKSVSKTTDYTNETDYNSQIL